MHCQYCYKVFELTDFLPALYFGLIPQIQIAHIIVFQLNRYMPKIYRPNIDLLLNLRNITICFEQANCSVQEMNCTVQGAYHTIKETNCTMQSQNKLYCARSKLDRT